MPSAKRPVQQPSERPVLTGNTLPELSLLLEETIPNIPRYRAGQIFSWIARGAKSFTDMSDLPLLLRENLAENFDLYSTDIGERSEDRDGTIKIEVILSDGSSVEAVILADGDGRQTACLSTQVGCPVGCVFCKTGNLGFLRNLTRDEIVEQFFHLKSLAGDISNIVIMGMGEPLLNLDALAKAIDIWRDPKGLGISPRRITFSSSGIISGIDALITLDLPVRLAISITSAEESLRNELMPIGKSNPLPLLKEALIRHQNHFGKRITLEAVLLGDINMRKKDAEALRDFAKGLDVFINLIPWNPVEGLSFKGENLRPPSPAEIKSFTRMLKDYGLNVQKRLHKGREVMGACGQLGSLAGITKEKTK